MTFSTVFMICYILIGIIVLIVQTYLFYKSKKNKKNSLTRKERAAHLIQKGALLEIAGIDDVDSETLLGYFLWFKDVPEEKLEKLKAKGRVEFERRKQDKK